MATAAPIALAAPAGATLYAGKFQTGLYGGVALGDAAASGALGSNATDLSGSILLDQVLPTGALGAALGNQRLLIWGQSNADGRALIADLSSAPLSSDPGLVTLASAPFERVKIWDGSAYVALTVGVNNAFNSTQFGPEFGLAVRWMRETASGTLYIDKTGLSGASITSFAPGQSQFVQRDGERGQANTWLATNGVTLSGESFVWVQGETDKDQTQTWYQDRLQAILDAAYLEGWWSASDTQLLFQVGTTSTYFGAGPAAAKLAIAAANSSNIHAPPSPNHYGDGYHQNARGQLQLGYDAFSLIFGAPTITV